MTKRFISLFTGSVGIGQTTPHRATTGFASALLAVSGTPGLQVIVEGAIGEDAATYLPQEEDWIQLAMASSKEMAVLRIVPTLIRFRVVVGTMTRVVGNFYTDLSVAPISVISSDDVARESADLARDLAAAADTAANSALEKIIEINRGNLSYARPLTAYGIDTTGATDDTLKVQYAIDELAQDGGGALAFPPGIVCANIILPSNISLIGQGIYASTLKAPPRQE